MTQFLQKASKLSPPTPSPPPSSPVAFSLHYGDTKTTLQRAKFQDSHPVFPRLDWYLGSCISNDQANV